MSLLKSANGFFGLDIGTSAIRVVQLKGAGPLKNLHSYGQTAADGSVLVSDAKADREKIAQTVQQLIKQAGINSRNVAVNIPSNRVFTAVIDMDNMTPADLDKTMRYQVDALIPTPAAQSKIDWVPLGSSPKDPKKIEVLLSSVPNEFIEGRLDMLEAIGLNVIAIEPDSTALARAVIAPDSNVPQMVLDVGYTSADLLITIGDAPRLVRALPFGSQTIIRAVQQTLNVEPSQATQYVFKFGLGRDKLDGQIYNAVIGIIEGLMMEIDKSIKFFQGRYNAKLDRIVVTGGASAIPEFPLFIANRFNINVEIGNAWRNVNYPPGRQNELMMISNHFAVAAGLAEREQS